MEVLQDTYKDTKIGRIPKDWDVMMLNEITNYKSSNLSLNKLEENTGKYKLYGASGMLKGVDFYQTDKESFAIVKDGSGFGNLLWCDKNSSILGTLGRITNKEISDLKFCFYLTHTIKFKRYMSGSTIPHLYYKDYGNIKLPVPPLTEQKKIAAILSAVDEQISTTDKIIEKSKELKKGLMQKLFSEGIEHTEFKETKIGRIPKDWEVLRLGEVCLKIRDGNYGGSYPKANEFLNSGVPFLTSASIGGGNFIIKKKIKFISPEKHSELTKAHIKFGDVLFTNRGANVGSVALVQQELDDANIGPQLTYLRCKLGVIENQYLFNFMQSNSFQKQVKSLDNGTAMNFFGIGTTKTFKLPIPSLSEQQKIAAILSEADAKIEKEQTQKVQLEQLKKGLMQQLLTGAKRVKV